MAEGLSQFLDNLRGDVAGRPTGRTREKKTFVGMGWKEDVFRFHVARCLKIEDKNTGAVLPWGPLLVENQPQMRLLYMLMQALQSGNPARFLILKNRKVGMSTAIEMLMLSIAMQCAEITCGLIAHTDESTAKLFSMIRNAYENLPVDTRRQLPLRINNESKIQFGNKELEKIQAGELGHVARILSRTAAGSYPFTGDTVRVLHMSECAKFDSVGDFAAQQRFILSALGAVPKVGGSLVICESTANGQQGWFYETWRKATENISVAGVNWIPIFIPWMDDPTCRAYVPEGYDWDRWYPEDRATELELIRKYKCGLEQLMFRRNVIETEMNGVFELYDQEFPTTSEGAFLASGRPAVPRRYIKAMESNISHDYERYTARVVDGYQTALTYSVEDQ